MLRTDVSYPYPVLRPETRDFNNSSFKDDFQLDTTKSGFTLTPHFSVNNENIERMLAEGYLKYAVFIVCKDTLMRNVHYIDADNPQIILKSGTVHYRVDYVGYIVAVKDIDCYYDPDFSEGYQGINYRLARGSIIGIGSSRSFPALYQNDEIDDASSIISVLGSDQEKYMKIDLDCDHITVILPKEQCSAYKRAGNEKSKLSMLNSTVVIPALVEAISTIGNTRNHPEEDDADGFRTRPWFTTLSRKIEILSKAIHETEDNLYDYPTRTAQIIMNNNSDEVLKIIEGL